MKEKTIRARVLVKMLLDGKPVAINDVVQVDPDTFRNLVLKGRLEAADSAAELSVPSVPSVPISAAVTPPAVKQKK